MFGFQAKRELREINDVLDSMRPERIRRGRNTAERVASAIMFLEMKAAGAERELLMLKQKYEPTRERISVTGAKSMVHGGTGIARAPSQPVDKQGGDRPWYQTTEGPPGFPMPTGWPSEHAVQDFNTVLAHNTEKLTSGGGGDYGGGGASASYDSGSSSSSDSSSGSSSDSSSSSSSSD